MIRSVHYFSSSIYPRSAIDTAAKMFEGICHTTLQATSDGVMAEISSPAAGGENVAREFCNVALVAAIEVNLAALG